jgi:16S rRNA (adenine1518-N6/adenine1519-N6)-dimethyltransferase
VAQGKARAFNNEGIVRMFIPFKKQHGQNFLRDQLVADHAVQAVTLTKQSNVFEIGCGDGFLTRTILQKPIARLWCFEIDPEWANKVRKKISDPRLTIYEQDFLKTDFAMMTPHQPWVLLANLPYHISFPILHLLVEHRAMLQEGVVMLQEEVAQKLVKTGGRGYGYVSLFFQHYFAMKLLDKVPPTSFEPAPKVFSRLVHFKPHASVEAIPNEVGFWLLIKVAFKQPRRTLHNNLKQGSYDISKLPAEILALRAQQMDMQQLLAMWKLLQK